MAYAIIAGGKMRLLAMDWHRNA